MQPTYATVSRCTAEGEFLSGVKNLREEACDENVTRSAVPLAANNRLHFLLQLTKI